MVVWQTHNAVEPPRFTPLTAGNVERLEATAKAAKSPAYGCSRNTIATQRLDTAGNLRYISKAMLSAKATSRTTATGLTSRAMRTVHHNVAGQQHCCFRVYKWQHTGQPQQRHLGSTVDIGCQWRMACASRRFQCHWPPATACRPSSDRSRIANRARARMFGARRGHGATLMLEASCF